MDEATKRWLMDEWGFTEAEIAEKITGERSTKIAKAFGDVQTARASQADIAKTQADLKAANDRLNAEMAEWASLTAKEKEQATELQKSLEAALVRATQLETRLTTLATEHGVDPKALLEGTAVIPDKKPDPAPQPIDPSKFVGIDAFGNLMDFQLSLPANLQYIEREHFALTGEHLDTREIIAEIKSRAQKKDSNIDPVGIWESKYGVAEKRAAKAKKEHDAEIAAAEARGEERAMTQRAMPGPATPGKHAPVFGQRGTDGAIQARTSVLKRPQPESGVRSAAAALASHKYAVKAS